MSNTTPVLNAKNVGKQVSGPDGDLTLLQNITLQVNAGDSLAITGPSGSGKSTLLSLLAGLDVPTSGEVLLQGQAFSSLSEDPRARLRGKHCGFVFQQFQLVADLNAMENVMLPLEIVSTKMNRREQEERARHLLALVGLEGFSYADVAGFEHYFIEHDNPDDGINSIAYSYNNLSRIRF